MEHEKTDLRVIRTRKAIHDTFYEMIAKMDYEDITIKELTQRAMINRNTFYLHYESIDALMQELQDETIEHFIGKDVSYSNLDNLKTMIRVFFERAAQQSPVQEKILTSGSYRFVYESINKRIMEHRRETTKGAFGLDEASESVVFAYYVNITDILYRQ